MATHSETPRFVHLHLHTEYSLLDGGTRIADLVRRVRDLGMDAVAVTDHGNLHGAVEFYSAAKANGVKPILGIEAYIAPGDRTDRTYTGIADGGFHLVLLALDTAGWRNLIKLSSDAYLNGFYYKPRMDKATLARWNEGLVAINGHLGSSIAHHLCRFARTADPAHWDAAIAEARWHAETFAPDPAGQPRFYIELQRHVDEQEQINPHLIRLARQLGLPLVCDNDAHFLLAEDHDAHDSLVCISTGKLKEEPNRLRYPPQLYVKSPAEMHELFADYAEGAGREALDNTIAIAERCNVDLDFHTSHAPVVKIVTRDDTSGGGTGILPAPGSTPGPSPGSTSGGGADASHPAPSIQNQQSTINNQQSQIPPLGSTGWFRDFCARFELQPFDSHRDVASPEQLRRQCNEALRQLVEAGAVWRYGPDGVTPEIRLRLDRELNVLADKDIAAYFLIVWDFVNYARSRGIPANARGSGVGTMVGYTLGLSNACPVKYGLLFERFTDPDRSEYPDIDIDICQDGRAAVLEYVRRKYGHVAQIITFGTLKARAVVRDVGRVMNIPLPEVDRIAKLIPPDLGMTLDKALRAEPQLRAAYEADPRTKQLIDAGRRLEGLARHASVHAAGVVIATQPLENIIPLYRDPRSQDVITQWDGPTVEKVGLLKMDFLGLRTLSVVERARELVRATLGRAAQVRAILGGFGAGPCPESPREFGVREPQKVLRELEESETRNSPPEAQAQRQPAAEGASEASTQEAGSGKRDAEGERPGDAHGDGGAGAGGEGWGEAGSLDPLDLERLTYVDQNVLDLFRRGETAGVFQFESGGMRALLTGMRPDRLEDLIAANALFRPGPMDLIPDYNDRKHGRAVVPAVHPIVDRHTAETYGVMVYQEQVMQIIHELGDIPLREAYTVIKAISKKKKSVIDSARQRFIAGATGKGLSGGRAEELFELILKFAGYGFNKSHSTGYAIVAYQTAYLKTYFPLQYMAALLTYESVSTEKVTEYMEACRRVRLPNGKVGIEVRPPEINLSRKDFTVVFEPGEPRDPNHGHIRFGLSAVKGVGGKAIESILEARDAGGPFTSLYDFCERVPQGLVNKSVIEALVRCGAFDALHGAERRAAMMAAVEGAMKRGAQHAELHRSDDFLFGEVAAPPEGGGASDAGDGKGGATTSGGGGDEPALPEVAPWETGKMLAEEKAVLGFYISSHPLDKWRGVMERFGSATVAEARGLREDAVVVVGGMIGRVRQTVTRAKQERMAIATLEDTGGSIDAVAFPRAFAEHGHLLMIERVVLIEGRIDRRREEANLIVERVVPAEEAAEQLTRQVRIILHAPGSFGSTALADGQDARPTPGSVSPGSPGSSGSASGGGRDGRPTDARAAVAAGAEGRSTGRQAASGTRREVNGELSKLRAMLRQSAGRGPGAPGSAGVAGAPVVFEVHAGGRVVVLEAGRLRVRPDGQMAERVNLLLGGLGRCELIGPGKRMTNVE